MKTPKYYNDNLSNKIITLEMLELVLYSINKRAKNYRDKKNEYYLKGKMSRYNNDYAFQTVDKYKEKEKEYYELKDLLLRELLKPSCIHLKITERNEKNRYYDYEEEFYSLKNAAIYSGEYFDRVEETTVEFIDVLITNQIKEYFLFYETQNYSFHIPINDIEVSKYNLQVISINSLATKGKEIKDLISVQFCTNFIKLVKSANYIFIDDSLCRKIF